MHETYTVCSRGRPRLVPVLTKRSDMFVFWINEFSITNLNNVMWFAKFVHHFSRPCAHDILESEKKADHCTQRAVSIVSSSLYLKDGGLIMSMHEVYLQCASTAHPFNISTFCIILQKL